MWVSLQGALLKYRDGRLPDGLLTLMARVVHVGATGTGELEFDLRWCECWCAFDLASNIMMSN